MSHAVSTGTLSHGRALFGDEPYLSPPEFSESLFALLARRLREVREHYSAPVSRQPSALEARFRALTATWRSETSRLSSVTAIATHPAYQQIVGMGPAAIPLILKELEQRNDHWFWALKAIAGVDPVPADQRGRINAMREAWLRWGRESGLI